MSMRPSPLLDVGRRCQVDGCDIVLLEERRRNYEVRTCSKHQREEAVLFDGVSSRFCQQCVKFHNVEAFDGKKRSCRERLTRHNEQYAIATDRPRPSHYLSVRRLPADSRTSSS
eukprot:scaffold349463_cov45-Prasinocladus_malaysianus.AAC.1